MKRQGVVHFAFREFVLTRHRGVVRNTLRSMFLLRVRLHCQPLCTFPLFALLYFSVTLLVFMVCCLWCSLADSVEAGCEVIHAPRFA